MHILHKTALTATLISAAFAQRPPAFPVHPQAEAATLARGKALYGVNCNFCHGSDARGGEGGPNLLRSDLVLNDLKGELITPVVLNGRGEMPALKLTEAQIADVAAYIHDFKVGGYDISRMTPPSVVVGDPKAGEAYFGKVCASCHSVTGDLKGISGKFANPKLLQNAYLSGSAGGGRGGRGGGGGGGTPTTVTITPTTGPKVEGRLVRIDDFLVTVALPDKSSNDRNLPA